MLFSVTYVLNNQMEIELIEADNIQEANDLFGKYLINTKIIQDNNSTVSNIKIKPVINKRVTQDLNNKDGTISLFS